jgi:hypothetical protein
MEQLSVEQKEDLKNSLDAFLTTYNGKIVYVCDDCNEAELTAWSWAVHPNTTERLFFVEYWDRKSTKDSFEHYGTSKIDGFAVAANYPNKLRYISSRCGNGGFAPELLEYNTFELAPGRSLQQD